MASTRWSEKDLRCASAKIAQSNSSRKASASAENPVIAPTNERKKNTTISRRNTVIESISRAKVSGTFEKGNFIEIMLDGAQLLSVNSLYALNPFQRTAYKKAWHDAINFAFIQITGGPRNFGALDKFTIEAQIRTQRRCDTDAPEGQLKFAIDGLTRARVITDDNPRHFIRFDCKPQIVGKPHVYIKVTAEK